MAQDDVMNSKRLILKFIVVAIKKLISGPNGNDMYAKNVDDVFEDIFGIKKFGTKFTNSFDDKELIASLSRIPLELLYEICNDVSIYGAISDLVLMDFRIDKVKKSLQKLSKKHKKNKGLTKEYDYLKDLYKDTVKRIRKKLGLKNSSGNYKKQYQKARSFNNHSQYDDDDLFMLDDDSIFGQYIYGDDDDDDYSRRGAFDSFKKLYAGDKKPARKEIYEDDEDTDVDLDDDDDHEEIHDKIDSLTESVGKLTEVVSKIAGVQIRSNASRRRQTVDTSEARREFDRIMASEEEEYDEDDGDEVVGEETSSISSEFSSEAKNGALEATVLGLVKRTASIMTQQGDIVQAMCTFKDLMTSISEDVKAMKTGLSPAITTEKVGEPIKTEMIGVEAPADGQTVTSLISEYNGVPEEPSPK